MEKEKMNFFTRIIKSISDFKVYSWYIEESFGKAFGYLMLFALLIGGLAAIKPSIVYYQSIDSLSQVIEKDLPEFQLKNGQLEIDAEMPIYYEEDNSVIIIDTTGETNYNVLENYNKGVYIGKNEMINKKIGKTEIIEYKNIEFFELTKDKLKSWAPKLKYFVIIIILYMIISSIIGKIVSTLFISLLALVVNSIMGAGLQYKELYSIGIYSITGAALLKFILKLIGVNIPHFFLIYYGIVIFYLYMAIKNILEQTKEDGIIEDL